MSANGVKGRTDSPWGKGGEGGEGGGLVLGRMRKVNSLEEAFIKNISHTVSLVCRWFRFAQLAKGKKSRP
jgi:hypothetical protein